MKTNSYDKYIEKMIRAQNMGSPDSKIIEELELTKAGIRNQLSKKLAELMFNKSPYPEREAKRLAQEHIAVIDRIIGELKKEKVS